MTITNHELIFSSDRPDDSFQPLLTRLQQRQHQSSKGTLQEDFIRSSMIVYFIDEQPEKIFSLSHFLSTAGYRPIIVPNPLEAFTLFLRETIVPIAFIIRQRQDLKNLHFQRLFQRIAQQYNWNPAIILLQETIPGSISKNLYSGPLSRPLPNAPSGPLSTTGKNVRVTQPSTQPLAVPPVSTPSGKISSHLQIPTVQQRMSLNGQSLGRYQIEEQLPLSNDTLGAVYKTYDRLREQKVALKAISVDAFQFNNSQFSVEEDNFFQQEADRLRPLQHPCILPILSTGKSYISGSSFIYKIMPYCEERSLAYWLYQRKKAQSFSPSVRLQIIAQLGELLQWAHDHAILYGNFKMTNILIREYLPREQKITIALSDFLFIYEDIVFAGTGDARLYLAPECWSGSFSPASDQYGLAAMAYELLTGRAPFLGSSDSTLKHLHLTQYPTAPRQLNPSLRPAIDDIVLRALSKKPEERFPSIRTFVQNLLQYYNLG